MIEWQTYIPEDPPELNKPFIVYSQISGYLTFAKLEFQDGGVWWVEAGETTLVWETVTHYAPINVPK
jgi:hypothetical protein